MSIAFIDWVGVGLVYPMFSSILFHEESLLLPPFTSDFSRGFWLGVLLSAMPLGQFFSSPIMGSLSDVRGRKPVLLLTLGLSLIGYSLSALGVRINSLIFLLAGRLIVGIAAGNVAVAGAVMADLSGPEEKEKNFGLLNMAGGIGFTVGPFLGGILSENSWFGGFDKPFIVSGVLTGVNLFCLYFLFDETYPVRNRMKVTFSFGLANLRKAFITKEMKSLLVCIFLFCFGWSFYWEFLPIIWIEDFGMGAAEVGNFYAYAAAIYALSCGFLIRPVLNWVKKPARVLFFSLSGLAIYIAFFPLDHPRWLWVYLPFQQSLTAFLFPTAATLVSHWADPDIQGESMGIYQSTQALAFGLSPVLSGAFVGISHQMPIIIGSLSMFLAALTLGINCSKAVFDKQSKKYTHP